MEGMSVCIDQFSRTFEASARRWELIVYPSLLAFIILATYGFYLIYKLTSNVDTISSRMDLIAENMTDISGNMTHMTGYLKQMTQNVSTMSDQVGDMSKDVHRQAQTLDSMVISMDLISQSVSNMSLTIHQIRYDTSQMGRNLQNTTGPMRFMNNFTPW